MASTESQPVLPLKKPKARIARLLAKRGPQIVENTKKVLFLKGRKTSQEILDVVGDLSRLMKPHCKVLNRKNEILPFEDANSLEFLTTKNDTSLFTIASHSKKRPNNLVMGRTFDGHILDMFEFGVEDFQSLSSFAGSKKMIGSKPLLLFHGSQWDVDSTYQRMQNFFLDYFRGDRVDKMSLKSMDHVISFSVVEGKVLMRVYLLQFKKSGTKVPASELLPMGPFLALKPRRLSLAREEVWSAAMKQPKSAAPPKIKNVSRSALGGREGRLHVKRQGLDGLGGRRVAALRDTDRGTEREGKRKGVEGKRSRDESEGQRKRRRD